MAKFLILDFYYKNYLKKIQKESNIPSVEDYEKKLEENNFSAGRFNARALRKLGHTVETFPVNDDLYQKLWLKENSSGIFDLILQLIIGLPFFRYKLKKFGNDYIIKKKIKQLSPDILFIQSVSFFEPQFFDDIKDYTDYTIAHISSPMPPERKFKPYDLIITSFPHYVEKFKEMGKKSVFIKLAFDHTIRDSIEKTERDIDVSFIGSFFKVHDRENKMLEELAKKVDVDFWGHGIENLSPDSPILENYHGQAWGTEMFKILARSKITINRHSKQVAKNYANNMRLYEATGMGTLLITDMKENLGEIFKIGEEVVVYNDVEDLIQKINYYLNNEKERGEISRKGQTRTLQEHTYDDRMKTLNNILKDLNFINE